MKRGRPKKYLPVDKPLDKMTEAERLVSDALVRLPSWWGELIARGGPVVAQHLLAFDEEMEMSNIASIRDFARPFRYINQRVNKFSGVSSVVQGAEVLRRNTETFYKMWMETHELESQIQQHWEAKTHKFVTTANQMVQSASDLTTLKELFAQLCEDF